MESGAEAGRPSFLEAATRATSGATILASAILLVYGGLPILVYALGVDHEYFLQLAWVCTVGAVVLWLASRLKFLDGLILDDDDKLGLSLDRFLLAVWGSFALLVLLVVVTAERIPFLAALQGADPATVAVLRERFLKAREGWEGAFVYVNAILTGSVVPYALALMLIRRHRWRWMALAFFTVYCISFVEKIFFMKAAVPVLYLVAQRVIPTHLKPRTVVAAGVLLLALGTVAAGAGTTREEDSGTDFFTIGFAAQGPVAFVVWRAVAIPVLTAADVLRVYREDYRERPLGGATSSLLAAVTGVERVNLERQVFAAQFGQAETGTGSANSVYITEAFVNFGWTGVVLFSIVVGLIMRCFAVSRDEALRSLWMLFAFATFIGPLTGILFSIGFLFVLILSLLFRFDEDDADADEPTPCNSTP